MKKKAWLIIAVAVLLASLLFGCATSAGYGQDESEPLPEPTQAPVAPAAPGEGKAVDDKGGSIVIDVGNAANSGKKIIYQADITLEAKDAVATADSIADKANEVGGYMSDSQVYEDRRDAVSYITVRIPPEKLKEFTKFLSTLGKGIYRNVTSQDVTANYYDLESNLKNAQAQEVQLLEIMKQAYKVEDILAVREQLNNVQREIEQYKGQLRLMDNQVGYATVRITIQQPTPPAVVVEEEPDKGVQFWGFDAIWQKIARGVSDSFNWTLNAIAAILIVFSNAIVPLALIAAVVVAIVLIVKVSIRKNRKQQQPPKA